MGSKDWPLERRLRTQFRKYIRGGYLKNAELDPSCPQFFLPLVDNEIYVVHISAKDGVNYYLTNERIISTASEPTTIMWYQDLVKLEWITDNSEVEDKIRLKSSHYDRIFLKDKEDNQITLSGLDQAVFPLMKFLGGVISNNTKQ